MLRCLLVISGLLYAALGCSQSVYSLNSSEACNWWVKPVDEVSVSVTQLSAAGFDMTSWVKATVPGTFFVDYVNAGLEANPDFGDNIYRVDETKYNKPFWYRAEFEVPNDFVREKVWLHFQGVNKEGTFYFNGKSLGKVKGFMLRSVYEVSAHIRPGRNVILVKIELPDVRSRREPTWALDSWANFAMPSYMSSASWDWMPYVPGLNCGMTGEVYLSATGNAALRDCWVRTVALAEDGSAELRIECPVRNATVATLSGIVRGTIMPGNIKFEQAVTVAGNSTAKVVFDAAEFGQLRLAAPRLWWPNGYGDQPMYTCKLEFESGNKIADTTLVHFGIRKYGYKKENGAFTLYINNSKILVRGGNWGMTEYLQRSRGEAYKTRIRLHADMNFNMIRLWTGCVTDDEFYRYCDEYGIMVWDDFWFHGYLFAPDQTVFMNNAIDKIKRLRNHACIAVWCGANEGIPGGEADKGLDLALREAVRDFDGNDRHYQRSSNSGGGLSGSGWWVNQHPRTYFKGPNSSGGGDWGGAGTWAMRTEIGTATFTTFESFREFIPIDSWWPPKNEMWNKHFFGNQAQTAGTDTYFNTVNANYGSSSEIDEFCEKSQYLNLEVMKAIFEGWNHAMWNNATGVLIWMSQSAYPSFVWQTYDYYFDATGAYWGAKKACEPLHIQWNYETNDVKVINTTLNAYQGLSASAVVYNLNGEVYQPLTGTTTLNPEANSSTSCFVLTETGMSAFRADKTTGNTGVRLTDVNFIRLALKDSEGKLLSENFYWRNQRAYNYQALNTLPLADVRLSTSHEIIRDSYVIQCELTNNSATVAFGNRLKVTDKITGKRILPVYMNDNYFTLMPGESKQIRIEFDEDLATGRQPEVVLKQYGDYDSGMPSGSSTENWQPESWQLYPNPVTDKLFTTIRNESVGEYKIFDTFGRQLMTGYATSGISVDELASGLYFFQVEIEGKSSIRKFIKR